MTSGDPTLAYESGVPGALAPGERLLWEDHPHRSPPKPQRGLAIAAILMLPIATAITAGVGTRWNPLVVTISAVVVAALAVTAVSITVRNDAAERAGLEQVHFRITDRRVIRWDDRPGRRKHFEAAIESLTRIVTVHGRRGEVTIEGEPAVGDDEITIDGVEFSDLHPHDLDALALRIIELCRRSGRRTRQRRTVRPDAVVPMHANLRPITDVELPPQVVLAPDEIVLWTGRPRVHDPLDRAWVISRLHTLAWQIIPTLLLLSSLGYLPAWAPRAHWAVGAVSVIWLTLGMYQLMLDPFFDARRRARYTYVLTNLRAINHESGKKPVVRSYLLDLVSNVGLHESGNGAAEVWIGGTNFTRVPSADAQRLYAIALEAVRATGGSITPPDSATSAPPA